MTSTACGNPNFTRLAIAPERCLITSTLTVFARRLASRRPLHIRRKDTPLLTREEEDWFSSNHTTLPSQGSPEPMFSILGGMYLTSKTIECIRGSSLCTDLGDYANNSWPQGGMGYPVAISSVSERDDVIFASWAHGWLLYAHRRDSDVQDENVRDNRGVYHGVGRTTPRVTLLP